MNALKCYIWHKTCIVRINGELFAGDSFRDAFELAGIMINKPESGV